MQIILDNIIFSLQKSGGISVYWYELVNRFINIKQDITFSFIEESEDKGNIFRSNLEINSNILLYNYNSKKKMSRYREVDLDIKQNTFIFHSSYYRTLNKKVKKNNSVKEVVTVHDFTYEHFSTGLKKWVSIYQKKKAIKAADAVICISENTKKDLLFFYPQFSDKNIIVIHNGVSQDYFRIPNIITSISDTPFFLFVGSRADYKNFYFTVEAVAQTNDFCLKIVGGGVSPKELILLNSLIKGRWEILIDLDNEKLNVLYNTAFALIYPSFYEGFGIPLVEAMKAGCPFIAFNGSSIPEVVGSAGILIDELEIKKFNDAVLKIKREREEIIKIGINQAENFSWEKCYQQTLEVYSSLYKL